MIDLDVLAHRGLFIDPVNDGRHQLRDAPFARESIPYVMSLPDEEIGAFVYTWVDRDSRAGFACAIFGPGVPDGPIVARLDEIPVPAGQNFDAWRVGGFELRQDMALDTAHFRWEGERARIDLQFEAIHPAYGYDSHPQGCPSYLADNRIEQGGRAVGTLTIDGREIAFDTTCQRDHSWGTRDWEAAHHWKWLVCQSGADSAIHVFDIIVHGRHELRGYVFKDGRLAEVTAFDCTFELDGELRQKSLEGNIIDALGRSTRVTVDVIAVQPLIPEAHTILYEGAVRATIDGRPGVGWLEFKWPAASVDHAKRGG